MRHRVLDQKFNRHANARKALLFGLLRNLTEHGQIVTTVAKAKAVKRLADKAVSRAQVDSIANRRILHRWFGRRDVVSTLVERVAPAMKDRSSGFTSWQRTTIRRGDSTQMVKLAWTTQPAAEVKSGLKKPTPVVTSDKTTAVKPVRKAATKKVAADQK